jgi:hypothetical protein
VRLTRKFSNILNGIDLTRVRTGDTVDMPVRDAHMLVAEGWAEPAEVPPRDQVPDQPRRPRKGTQATRR